MNAPHGAVFGWSEIEEVLTELAQAKLTNRRGRDASRMVSLGAELATIREVYIRMHARAYPLCNCGPRCWKTATDSVFAEGVVS